MLSGLFLSDLALSLPPQAGVPSGRQPGFFIAANKTWIIYLQPPKVRLSPYAPAVKYLKALIINDNMKLINFVRLAYKAQAHCLSGFAPYHSHCAES